MSFSSYSLIYKTKGGLIMGRRNTRAFQQARFDSRKKIRIDQWHSVPY
jgi:hypothetical protein